MKRTVFCISPPLNGCSHHTLLCIWHTAHQKQPYSTRISAKRQSIFSVSHCGLYIPQCETELTKKKQRIYTGILN